MTHAIANRAGPLRAPVRIAAPLFAAALALSLALAVAGGDRNVRIDAAPHSVRPAASSTFTALAAAIVPQPRRFPDGA